MNKKFLIAGIIAIALIFIILILIVVLGNAKEKKVINTTEVAIVSNSTENKNEVTNNTTIRPVSNTIVGDIDYFELEDGHSIPIPPTFSYVEGDIESGAVIEDGDGNQFVWVPINEYIDYTRFLFERNGEYTTEFFETTLDDSADYDSEYDDSIKNYGGFYVARYEAGEDTETGKVVSQPNILPWTGIGWEQAKDVSYNMYDENEIFQTDLINSYAWDSICLWLRNSDYDIDDSTDYGNYKNGREGLGISIECGSNKRFVTNNIFDMAGNVWELTTEKIRVVVDGNFETAHIARGGGNWNNGNELPISSRYPSDLDAGNIEVGFRVVLYLK